MDVKKRRASETPTPAVDTPVMHLTGVLFLPDHVRPINVHRWTQQEHNPAHDHDFVEIALVLEGEGLHHTAHDSTAFAPGDVFLIRPGIWHRYEPNRAKPSSLTLYNCLFDPRYLRRELGWLYDDPAASFLLTAGVRRSRNIPALKLTPSDGGRAARHWLDAMARSLARKSGPVGGSPMIAALALLMLFLEELTRHFSPAQQEAVRQAATFHPAVRHALRLLEEEFRRAWTLAALGREVHLDPSYLVKLFTRFVGTPPMTYLNQLRCEKAAALLTGTAMTAAEIGATVGFDDPNYFSRRFRAHFDQSPTEFRRRGSRV